MRIEQSYLAPVHGVSTLAPRARPKGYASRQLNFRSDPVNKLTRRPSSVWRGRVATVSEAANVKYHTYRRGGVDYSFVADSMSGYVHCMVNDVVKTSLPLASYNGDNLEFFTIEHDTYILNKDKVVATSSATDTGTIQKVSHINVTSALNYSESITVTIIKPDNSRVDVNYTVPALGDPADYDTADKARATSAVATGLASKIIALTGLSAEARGSSVGVWVDGRADWVQLEIAAGQGERTTVAINQVIESTDGLPLYAVVGTRIKVRPDPTTDNGTYYLQAERVADDPSGTSLEEVIWSEDRNPNQRHSFDATTMPHIVSYDDATDTFTLGTVNWKPRQAGDDDSVPFPEFVGNTLTTMGYFQKRLVVASENAVYMTETDDLRNWFKQSAVKLLVNDTLTVTTSALGADMILHLVPHNRDLLCMTSNAQFKISGGDALTPQTVSMPLTTKYECQISVSPVTIGNSVYFPIDYGDSTGLQEYTGQRETTQDFAAPVTNHIIGYLEGEATLMAASPNLEMIALKTASTAGNKLFIYDQYTASDGKRSQRAWSEWVFADDEVIVDLTFRRNELVMAVVKGGSSLYIKAIPMYARIATSDLEVYLDDMITLDTDGATVTLPANYSMDNCIVVRGKGTQHELWKAQFTQSGDTLTFRENIGAGQVYIGREFVSEYEPTRPFRYDNDGSTITTDRIRVSRWTLSLVDTHTLTMIKNSQYGEDVQIVFDSRFVGNYVIGTQEAYTGDWKFSFSDDAAYSTATFRADGYLGATIVDISWEGQYFQSKQRMA